jgi:hypothetical protein
MVIDDTIERRRGQPIEARGIYRVPPMPAIVIALKPVACAG